MNPFEKMYASFSLFGKAAKVNKQKFYPLSAGVNWMKSNSAILKLMHFELDSGVSYRNYGNSGGSRVLTDILANIEKKRTKSRLRPSVVISNGSSEGSYLIFEYLKKTKFFKDGDTVMMLSHGFPLYAKLSSQFNLNFVESLYKEHNADTFLSPMDKVLNDINVFKPKLIFLLLPNNPLGERYTDSDLIRFKKKCREHNIKILIDRVCLMPWDDFDQLNQIFIEDIMNGNVFIVDSMSKSESLAGVRTGYIVTNQDVADGVTEIIQYRNLNPVVYSTFSMAISKMFSMSSQYENESQRIFRLYDFFESELFSGFPSNEDYNIREIITEELFDEYFSELEIHKNHIHKNYSLLNETFSNDALNNLQFQSGFNVALSTSRMKTINQEDDQKKLAVKYNVGILPEFCFRSSVSESENYFVRVGLTIPSEDFKIAIMKLKKFYSKEYK